MKLKTFSASGQNSGQWIENNEEIDIKRGGFIKDKYWYPMTFKEISSPYDKKIYCLKYGENGFKHISFTGFWENQIFLFKQGVHWFQKEENIRYVVNMILIFLTAVAGFSNAAIGLLNYYK